MSENLNNSVYGKEISFDLSSNESRTDKLEKSPFFKESVIFTENLVGIHRYKMAQKLDKPIFIEAAILEVSKLLMYDFFYRKLPDISRDIPYHLLYNMDNDSCILSVRTPNTCPHIIDNSQSPFRPPILAGKCQGAR